jgi:hypothetical protein
MVRYRLRICELSIVHGCRKWFVLCTLVRFSFTTLACWCNIDCYIVGIRTRLLKSNIIRLGVVLQLQAETNMPGQNTNIIVPS